MQEHYCTGEVHRHPGRSLKEISLLSSIHCVGVWDGVGILITLYYITQHAGERTVCTCICTFLVLSLLRNFASASSSSMKWAIPVVIGQYGSCNDCISLSDAKTMLTFIPQSRMLSASSVRGSTGSCIMCKSLNKVATSTKAYMYKA